MHIEKNMFENIFNTVMDVKGKTKDNIKARLDIALYCNRKNMELVYDESRVAKPRASFMLEKNAQLLVYKWLKSLRFPDGHASNISRLVNIEDCRLYGMKSHECYVFMQTLIPLAFRDLLLKGIWDALTEISHFFRDICSSKLNVDHIERLQRISSIHYANLRWYSLHHFLTQWSISLYIYRSRQKLEDRSNIDGCTHSNG